MLVHTPKAAIYVPGGLCVALLLTLAWRAESFRKRWMFMGGAGLVGGLLAGLVAAVPSPAAGARSPHHIGIRSEGERLFVQATEPSAEPTGVLWPPLAGELLPASQDRFFERLSGRPMTFTREAQDKRTFLTVHCGDKAFTYEKVSEQPPKAPEARTPRVAVKLDLRLLDACAGDYELPPRAGYPHGLKGSIRREGDQLVWRERGEQTLPGAIRLYPESETNFFDKVVGGRLTVLKNGTGEVTAVLVHDAGRPDWVGKKVK